MDKLPISQIDLKGLDIDIYRTTLSGNAYLSGGALLDLTTGKAYVIKELILPLEYVGMNYIYYDIQEEKYQVSNILLKQLKTKKLLFIIEKRENGSIVQIINATKHKNRDLLLPNISEQVYSTETEHGLKIEKNKIYVKNHNVKKVQELYIHKVGVVKSKSILSVSGKCIILDGDNMDGRLCDVTYFW